MTNIDEMKPLEALFKSLKIIYKGRSMHESISADENLKVKGLKLMRDYVTNFNEQVLEKLPDNKEKMTTLSKTRFLKQTTSSVLVYLTDYYDSVR